MGREKKKAEVMGGIKISERLSKLKRGCQN